MSSEFLQIKRVAFSIQKQLEAGENYEPGERHRPYKITRIIFAGMSTLVSHLGSNSFVHKRGMV